MKGQDKFTGNVEELRRIINENIWFGADNRDLALEFLEAIENNHTDDIDQLKRQIEERDDEISDLKSTQPNFDDDIFIEVDLGIGNFIYLERNINLAFQEKLDQFIENFKNGKA